MGISLALTVDAMYPKYPPLHASKTSSNVFLLSVKLEQRSRNCMKCFMPRLMGLCVSTTPEPTVYASFLKIRARSSGLSHMGKAGEGISDLPSASEMDGKGMTEWFLAACEALGR